MKKKYLWLVCLVLVVVGTTACGKKEDKPAVKKTTSTVVTSTKMSSVPSSTVSSDMTSSESTSQVTTSSEPSNATPATFNGSYYSVQGKYGEVIIVNKKHPLSDSYGQGEDPTALSAFWQLVKDMQAAGFDVSNQFSGFRSYATQTNLYNSYVASDGQANADRYSARPGYSEHQTGLAFDLMDSSGALLSEPTAVHWLAKHAHQYGFIVRYIIGKEDVTGYMPETWHIRYIGQEATDIYQSGLTLEEYFHVPGGDYAQ